jgi:hypothetical protein
MLYGNPPPWSGKAAKVMLANELREGVRTGETGEVTGER